jgi:tetratricopeptide (TPR) repeat protein
VSSTDPAELDRVQAQLELGRVAAARELVGGYLARHPDDARGLCLLALCQQRDGSVDAMLDAAERACAAEPRLEWGHRLRAQALTLLDRPVEAVAAARTAVRLGPDRWQCHAMLAFATSALPGRRAVPLAAAAEAVRLAPDQAEAHHARGLVLHASGRFGAARRSYLRVLRLDPQHAGAMRQLGRIAERRGQAGTALRYFGAAAATAPADTAGATHLRRILLRIAGLAWATAAMLTIVLVFGRYPVAWLVAAALAGGYLWWAGRALRALPAPARAAARGWLRTDARLLVRVVGTGVLAAVAVAVGVGSAVFDTPGHGGVLLLSLAGWLVALLASALTVVGADLLAHRRRPVTDAGDPTSPDGAGTRLLFRVYWASCVLAAALWVPALLLGADQLVRATLGVAAGAAFLGWFRWLLRRARRARRRSAAPLWTRLVRLAPFFAIGRLANLVFAVAVVLVPDSYRGLLVGTAVAPGMLIPAGLLIQGVRLVGWVRAGDLRELRDREVTGDRS